MTKAGPDGSSTRDPYVEEQPESVAKSAERRAAEDAAMRVRAADMEPYVGLRYVARLFRMLAVALAVLLLAELITGLRLHGAEALVLLLAEGGRLAVLAGLLWGSADLALLLIDVGHDVRATRILLGRQLAHHADEHHSTERPTDQSQ